MGIPNPVERKPVALIAGPTASGKTALALWLGQRRDVMIVNADSAQVYRHLPILSAQPTAAEMAGIPHRLFGYLDGQVTCSAARWAADAKRAIEEAHRSRRLPVLVGGTGLYLRTLLDGIAPIPEIDADVRAQIRAMATADAYAELIDLDPAVAFALKPQDDTRIKRALEVIRSTGRSMADWRREKVGGIAPYVTLHPLILLPPRDWLHQRCNQRFEMMMASGAIEEVEALLKLPLPADSPVLRVIGVPEITAMLSGKISQKEAIERGQAATRQYAKRQYTWFRNQPPGSWPQWIGELNDSEFRKIEQLFQFL
jgi:tRNA dimethylallyltransferase